MKERCDRCGCTGWTHVPVFMQVDNLEYKGAWTTMTGPFSPCKKCGRSRLFLQKKAKVNDMEVTKEILALSKDIMEENSIREERLKAKCRWEHMSRTAVLGEYGDPANWESKGE